MDRRAFGAALFTVVPLAVVGGLVYANSRSDAKATTESSCCAGCCQPTAEELPRENCCSVNAEK